MSGIETDTHVSTDVLRPKVSEKMETDTHVSTDVLEKGGRLSRYPTSSVVRKGGTLPMFVTPLTPMVPHVPEATVNVKVGEKRKKENRERKEVVSGATRKLSGCS